MHFIEFGTVQRQLKPLVEEPGETEKTRLKVSKLLRKIILVLNIGFLQTFVGAIHAGRAIQQSV